MQSRHWRRNFASEGRARQRWPRRNFLVAVALLVSLVGFLVGAVSVSKLFSSGQSSTVTSGVIASQPVIVWMLDTATTDLTIISIPGQSYITATHGYGTYSLEALWRLGQIEKKEGTLLVTSLSEALGLPLSWYIGGTDESLSPGLIDDPYSIMGTTFSFRGIQTYMKGAFRTNMTIVDYLTVAGHLSRQDRSKVKEFRLSTSNALVEVKESDETSRLWLEEDRFDRLIGTALEQSALRLEGVRVGIYNTTQTLGLGQKAGRLLSHMGIAVFAIGNEEQEIDRCELLGEPHQLQSQTASLIVDVYGCRTIEEKPERTDLLLRLGTQYEKRFR